MRENTKYNKPDKQQLKQILNKEQYEVMVNGATERPFTSEHLNREQEGIYVDIASGEPLFTTFDQFESHCGWPSFTRPIEKECVREDVDTSHGMFRTEVRSGSADLHLGHVFTDGPVDRGGLRYCINGVAIRFIPTVNLEVEGYSYMIPYMNSRRKEQ